MQCTWIFRTCPLPASPPHLLATVPPPTPPANHIEILLVPLILYTLLLSLDNCTYCSFYLRYGQHTVSLSSIFLSIAHKTVSSMKTRSISVFIASLSSLLLLIKITFMSWTLCEKRGQKILKVVLTIVFLMLSLV